MTTTHVRTVGCVVFDGSTDEPPATQNALIVAAPGPLYTLTRTRLFLEFRICAYSIDDDVDIDFRWYRGLIAVCGLQYIAAATIPAHGSNPIDGAVGNDWVQWEGMIGNVELTQLSAMGKKVYMYRFGLGGGVSDSKAERQPHGAATQSLWLGWQIRQPIDIINRTHASFDAVYDLQVNYAVDSFWAPRPS